MYQRMVIDECATTNQLKETTEDKFVRTHPKSVKVTRSTVRANAFLTQTIGLADPAERQVNDCPIVIARVVYGAVKIIRLGQKCVGDNTLKASLYMVR